MAALGRQQLGESHVRYNNAALRRQEHLYRIPVCCRPATMPSTPMKESFAHSSYSSQHTFAC